MEGEIPQQGSVRKTHKHTQRQRCKSISKQRRKKFLYGGSWVSRFGGEHVHKS